MIRLSSEVAVLVAGLPADDEDARALAEASAAVRDAEVALAAAHDAARPVVARLERRALVERLRCWADGRAAAGAMLVPPEALLKRPSVIRGRGRAYACPVGEACAAALRGASLEVAYIHDHALRFERVELRADGREKGARRDGPVFVSEEWLAEVRRGEG